MILKIEPVRLRISLLLIAGLIAMAGVIFWSFAWQGNTKNIRAYRTEDRPALEALLLKDWYLLVDQSSTDFSMEYLFDHLAPTFHYPDNSLSIALYEADHKPVGFVTYHLLEGYRGRIQFLVIDQNYRKKGYGKLLIEYAIDQLQKRGVCFIDICVRTNNQSAKKLYLSLGFEEKWNSNGFLGLTKTVCSSNVAIEPSGIS